MRLYRFWTDHELELVRRLYPDVGAIHPALRHRAVTAIRKKAQRLGLTSRVHVWTGAEIARLRRLYPRGTRAEIMAAFPGWSYHYLQQVAAKHRISKTRPPHRPTNDPVVDQMLLRSRQLGISMPELDAMTNARGYFKGGGFRQWRNLRKLSMAIAVLGGDIHVQWSD